MAREESYNYAINYWKLFFALMVVAYHKTITDNFGGIWRGGYIAVDFFFIVSGYFMVSSYMKNKKDIEERHVGIRTLEFIKKKFKTIFPYIFISACSSFLLSCKDTSVIFCLNRLRYLVLELLLLNMSGFSEGARYTNWYVSALFLVIFILFPLLCYFKEDYIYIISPLLSILIYGWISQKIGFVRGTEGEYFGILRLGVWRGMAGVSAGSICWILSDHLSKLRLNKYGKMIVSMGIGFSIIVIISNAIFYPCSQQDFISIVFIVFLVAAIFSKQSFFYNLYNPKLSTLLREWSTAIFFMSGLGNAITVNLGIKSVLWKNIMWYVLTFGAAGLAIIFIKVAKYFMKRVEWKKIFIEKV